MFKFRKFIKSRPRLAFSFLFGAAVFPFLPASWQLMTRALLAWILAVWSYLALVAWLVLHADAPDVRRIAEQEDESPVAVLSVLSLSAILSLVAIVFELAQLKGLNAEARAMRYGFTGMTVLGSWCLLAVLFTFYYARAYYRSPRETRAMRFPDGEQAPDYWDFLYFSFTIAVAAQTSDVALCNRSMRKAVLAQSVLSFLFNAAILGFSINIAAGLVN